MTESEAIELVCAVAKDEVGYLEKVSPNQLDSKTANAGSANYTKYWRDVDPSYQGQPWCAAFVTWVFDKVFGRAKTKLLLRHYPYVYCPTMAGLFTLWSNPKPGDIVIFKRGGTFTHTGLVTEVSGDLFRTVEGNTSGGSGIVANGGGVFAKSYYNSSLPGTKFCRPSYQEILSKEDLTMTQYEELKESLSTITSTADTIKKELDALSAKVSERTGYYNYIDKNMNESYRPTIEKLVNAGKLEGNENGELMLTNDMMRILTILDRVGALG